jgi:hypothetical protein
MTAMVVARTEAQAQQPGTTVVARSQQPAPTPEATAPRSIDCGAAGGDRNTCDADTSSGVVLVRQTGDGTCALGKTWGFDAKGVRVAEGCRGTFVFNDDRVTVTCSAAAGTREVL